MSDPLAAMLAALGDTDGPPLRRPAQNHPFQPERPRAPRSGDPAKWSPPPYRDRDAERVAGRLSKKNRKKS